MNMFTIAQENSNQFFSIASQLNRQNFPFQKSDHNLKITTVVKPAPANTVLTTRPFLDLCSDSDSDECFSKHDMLAVGSRSR